MLRLIRRNTFQMDQVAVGAAASSYRPVPVPFAIGNPNLLQDEYQVEVALIVATGIVVMAVDLDSIGKFKNDGVILGHVNAPKSGFRAGYLISIKVNAGNGALAGGRSAEDHAQEVKQ